MTTPVRIGLVLLAVVVSIASVIFISQQQANKKETAALATHEGAQTRTTYQEVPASPALNKVDPYSLLALPKVEGLAPVFEHKTAEGRLFNSKELLGKKNLVLVFYQGNFCPVCGKQLDGFQTDYSQYKKLDTEIVAISADKPEDAKTTYFEHGLSFPVIADANKELIELFGVANRAKQGIAWPAVMVINKTGKVTLSYADPAGRRMQSAEVLAHLKGL